MTHVLLPAAVALFGLSTAFYLAALWSSRPALRRIGHTALGLTLLVAAGAVFALVGDPLEGTYTQVGLVVSALVLGAVYLVLARRYPIAGLGSFVSALATLLVHVFEPKPSKLNFWSIHMLGFSGVRFGMQRLRTRRWPGSGAGQKRTGEPSFPRAW